MLMPTKASRRRPRRPICVPPAEAAAEGGSLVKGISAQNVQETVARERRRRGSPHDSNFAIIAFRARMERQRHPRRRILDGYSPGGGMSLHKLIEVAENRLGNRVDRVGTQALARHQEI